MSKNFANLTQWEAEKNLKYMRDCKDFWVVDSMQNNFDLLQDTLDVLYDDCENCYKAEVVDNQSGSRLSIRCNVCNVVLSSYDPFVSHNKGKSHKKAVLQFCNKDNPMQNLLGPVTFKPLTELESNFEPGTLEDKLFTTTQNVLGWQMVYREIIDGKELYTCQLCPFDQNSRRMSQNSAFDHLVSDSHLLQYMRVKFNKKGSYHSLFDAIQDVQKMEGKIMCKITTINKEYEPRSSGSLKSRLSRDRSSSGSSSEDDTCSRTSRSEEKRGKESGCQTDELPQSMTDFMGDLTRHYDYIAKKGDHITEELKEDVDGQDLLIQVIKVLAQKLFVYSVGNEPEIENDSKSLLKKTEKLKLPQMNS